MRRLVESLLPAAGPRRANTDPIGPYLEALASVRLGLRDPDEVEARATTSPGWPSCSAPTAPRLAERGAVDFDEQVYGAIEALLTDGAFRRGVQRSCRHLLVDEFQDLTPAHVLLLRLLALPGARRLRRRRRRPGASTATPGPTRRSSSTTTRCSPAPASTPLARQLPLPGRRRRRAASTLLGYNLRRVPKSIVAGADATTTPPARCAVREHAPDDERGATLAETVQGWLADPAVGPASIAVLARVNSLLLAPHVGPARGRRADRLGADARRARRAPACAAALAYLRIGADPGGLDHSDVVEILRRPTRGLPQWFPRVASNAAPRGPSAARGASPTRCGDKDAAKVLRPGRRPGHARRTPAAAARRATLLEASATASASARR